MEEIKKKFISYNRTPRSSMVVYIVIHDTGDPGASAQNEHDYFAGGNRNACADFFVDSESIIQIIDTDNFYSWHCGDEGDGAMKTGWQKIDGKWYYFNSEGSMQTGWIKDKDKDYCLYSNGEMLQGCDMYGYRFLEDGVAVKL